jgi:hypothetical protein
MIVRPTVLVLGAGASKPYDFPTGPQLLQTILNGLSEHGSGLAATLTDHGHHWPALRQFRKALDLSRQPSVDAFLENRREYLGIGRDAMAASLIPLERAETLFSRKIKGDWYSYLWERIGAEPERFAENNRLSVLTFNYDRSFEKFFFTAWKNSYGASDVECARCLDALGIIHLHGQLGELFQWRGRGRGYSPEMSREEIRLCSGSIKIVSDEALGEEFTEALRLIRDAKLICFLGFGYHEQNVRRLGMTGLALRQNVYGTALGLEEGERNGVVSMFSATMTLARRSDDALVALKHLPFLNAAMTPDG